jgi:hypothetical protein
MTIKETSTGVPIHGPNGATGELISIEKVDELASAIESSPELFNNVEAKKSLLSNIYDGLENKKNSAIEMGHDALEKYDELKEEAKEAWEEVKESYKEYQKRNRVDFPEVEDPIPEISDPNTEDGYSTIDPSTGESRENYIPIDVQTGPCQPCKSIEPCCLQAGVITDRDEQTRFLKWPVTDEKQPTRMFVVAIENGKVFSDLTQREHDLDIIGRVDVQIEGKDCQRGAKGWPYLDRVSKFNGYTRESITKYKKDVYQALPCQQNLELALSHVMMNPVISPAVMSFIYFLSAVYDILHQKYSDTADKYMYRIGQCGANVYYPDLTILPVTYLKLSGSVSFELDLKISFGGLKPGFSFGANYEAIYGRNTYTSEKLNHLKPKSKPNNEIDTLPELPGPFKFLNKIINKSGSIVDEYRSKEPDLLSEKYSTYFQLFIGGGISVTGIETRAKPKTPDLSLDVGGISHTIGGGIRAQIDFIDSLFAFIAVYIKGAYTPLRNVRIALAKGENVSGECIACITGVGKIEHTVKIGEEGKDKTISVTIPANSNGKYDLDIFTDSIRKTSARIIGKGELALRAELQVWTIRAKTGIEGTAHTQLLWQWKNDPEQGELHRFYFEGLVASYSKYAEISRKEKEKGGYETTVGTTYSGNGDFQDENLGTTIDEKLNGTNTIDEKRSVLDEFYNNLMCASGKSEDCAADDNSMGKPKTIIPPSSVRNFDEYNPPWEKS